MSNVNKVNRLYSINVKLHRAVSQFKRQNTRQQCQIDQLKDDKAWLREALRTIANWSEFTIEERLDMGSNGQRDYYRSVAKNALAATEDTQCHTQK
jgi:hypothetical protein